MGSERFNRQFILLDFGDLDNPDFLSFTRSPEFSTYLLMRRHIWRSRDPHYMGLHQYYADGHLTSSLEREKIGELLGISVVSVSSDINALQRRSVIESLRTGRQNIFVLGRWVEEEGAYYEHFYLDRLYIRDKEDLISDVLDVGSKESLISVDKPRRTSEVKKPVRNNREGNTQENIEENLEMPLETSNIREASDHRARSQISDYIVDFAREFNDEAPVTSSVSRAMNLYRRAGVTLDDFIDMLYAARAATKERTGGIRKTSGTGGAAFGGSKNRMAYFFAVLEDLLGLAERREGGR